jgi:cytochrome c biogenesis protein ResB
MAAGDREVQLEFGRQQFPLGFSVHLVDFEETTYPGTTRSATYASDVMVASGDGTPVPIHITMNKPLKHNGFRLFQSSYVRQDDKEASIFSVSYDPGVTVVYTGFIIFIAGMVAIFYLKPFIKKAYLRSAASERTGS